MARYKKRSSGPGLQPGLFDELETSMFPEIVGFPTHPSVEAAAKKASRERELLFSGSDFSPLEMPMPVDILKFISFGSGSSGNCAYIGDNESGILIDAGIDATTVASELRRHGIKMESVHGILLTHDHSDHVRFVYSLVRKRKDVAVYCTPRVLSGMLRRHNISNRIKDYHKPIYKEHPFSIGGFSIVAFEVMHDGSDNSGFFISHGRHKMVVATDLGSISDRADFYMRQANHLMIEANYDEEMLLHGSYPEYLKARIRSDNGHLNNAVTARYLAEIYTPELKNVFLCHLSKDNNRPELALAAVERALSEAGATVGDGSGTPYSRSATVQLMALPRFDSSGLVSLRL